MSDMTTLLTTMVKSIKANTDKLATVDEYGAGTRKLVQALEAACQKHEATIERLKQEIAALRELVVFNNKGADIVLNEHNKRLHVLENDMVVRTIASDPVETAQEVPVEEKKAEVPVQAEKPVTRKRGRPRGSKKVQDMTEVKPLPAEIPAAPVDKKGVAPDGVDTYQIFGVMPLDPTNSWPVIEGWVIKKGLVDFIHLKNERPGEMYDELAQDFDLPRSVVEFVENLDEVALARLETLG